MGEFDQYLDMLSDVELENRRRTNMGELNLSEAITILEVARNYMELGNRLPPEEITENVKQQILSAQFRQLVQNVLDAMENYGTTTQSPSEERNRIVAQAKNIRDLMVQFVAPLLRADAQQLNAALSQVESLKFDIEGLKTEFADRVEELAKQQQAVASQSGAAASTGLAKHYKDQADKHRDTAQWFLIGAVVAGAVLLALVIVLFGWLQPDQGKNDWTGFAGSTTYRVLLLSVAGFALVFCVRNYRVNMHLEVLNKRRENALETFGLFQGAVTSEDARNLIVGELVRAVFAHEDTGYVNADSERTIIESQGGVVSALASMRGRDA